MIEYAQVWSVRELCGTSSIELFAKKIHTEQLCVKKSDGTEYCIDGDQLESISNGMGTSVVNNPIDTPTGDNVVDSTTTDTSNPTSDSEETVPESNGTSSNDTSIPNNDSDLVTN